MKSVAERWELYAQVYTRGKKESQGKYLGDEWNEPEVIGIDVPADQIVSYLNERVFAPFFGTPDVILEIGAGGGRFTDVLLPKCNKLIATDTSPTMVSLLRERFGNDPKLELVLLDGKGLTSISDNTVDAGFSYDVFVHLPHRDIFNYLCELERVLRPGGKAIIHHANTFSELGWKKFLDSVDLAHHAFESQGTFMLMTPMIMEEFTKRAGLVFEDCLTDIVRRDGMSLISKPRN